MTANSLDPVLDLNIANVSSSDPDFPPDIILKGDPLSAGWRTAPDQQSNHSITFSIAKGLAEVTQIQFVAHEIFTPQEVEVYFKTDSEFQLLGHIKMSPNTEGRQRKTFKIKIRTSEIKLVMNSVIQRQENPNNQVSLTSIIIRGKLLSQVRPGSQLMSAADDRAVPDAIKQQVSANAIYDERIQNLISKLQLDEAKYVQNDEFLNAERVKVAQGKILNFGKALDALEIKKVIAVKKKDYRAASIIKTSIDEIKQLLDEDYDDIVCILNNEPKKPKAASQPTIQPFQQQVQLNRNNSVPSEIADVRVGVNSARKPMIIQQQNNNSSDERPIKPAQPQQQQENIDPEEMVPQMDQNHSEDRPIQAKANYGFELTEAEKAEIDAERMKRAEEMKRERLGLAGVGKGGVKNSAAKQDESQSKQVIQKSVALDNSQPQQQLGSGQHFQSEPFDFVQAMSQLSAFWENSDQKPPQLPQNIAHTEEISVLSGLHFSDIYTMLLGSKSMEHIQDAVSFMECALKSNAAMYCDAGIALINILGMNPNLALLNHSKNIVILSYVGLMLKNDNTLINYDLKAHFDDVDQQLLEQKDSAVIYAQLEVGNRQGQTAAQLNTIFSKLQNNQMFQQDVLHLIDAPFNRLGEKQHRAQIQAINMISTLAGMPGFPDKTFISQLLSIQNINRQSGLKSQDQVPNNSKYSAILEARANAAFCSIEQSQWLVNSQTYSIIMQFIQFTAPGATKQEFKNNVMKLLQYLYEADDVQPVSAFLKELEKIDLKNEKLKQEISDIFKSSDQSRGGTQRLLYNTQQKRFALADSTSQVVAQQSDDQFQPGVCQFCLFDTHSTDPNVMKMHLLKDCPCCTICPACKILIETPFICEHLLFSCPNKEIFQLKQCPKCLNCFDVKEYDKHVAECQVKLKGEESCCPLCGEICTDGEQSLIHHSDGLCAGNVRTSAELKGVVQAKLSGK